MTGVDLIVKSFLVRKKKRIKGYTSMALKTYIEKVKNTGLCIEAPIQSLCYKLFVGFTVCKHLTPLESQELYP